MLVSHFGVVYFVYWRSDDDVGYDDDVGDNTCMLTIQIKQLTCIYLYRCQVYFPCINGTKFWDFNN